MKLSDFVCFDAVKPQLDASDRDGAISELVEALAAAGKIPSKSTNKITKAVIKRENEASTGIGKGVAVPHVKHAAIKQVVATVGCSSKGIDFNSLDKQPVYSVILLLSPADNTDVHLRAMENVFRNIQKDDFRSFLRQARTLKQIQETIFDTDEPEG
ncbi:MAG: PTS sugar transporter subunit IIA [Planctomycetota bacterium]|nr:MAG: PTS sugar transporter subunit IIA [Planctomycetota bacterium]